MLLKFFHYHSNPDLVKDGKHRLPHFVYLLIHFFFQYIIIIARVIHLRGANRYWSGENLCFFLLLAKGSL